MATRASDEIQSLFVTGLQNVHGVENQALSLMDRQLDHLENYPEVADMLRRHRAETEQQIDRVEEILSGLGESPSKLKDLALSMSGNMAALAHLPAPDEIIKNSFANHAFENFELAAYTSLIALSETGGYDNATPLLQQSHGEEKRMADWILSSIPQITLKYASLRTAGETAGH